MRIVAHEDMQADKRARLDAFRAAQNAEETPTKQKTKQTKKRERTVAVLSTSMKKYTKRLKLIKISDAV
jgi:hypothetical protein